MNHSQRFSRTVNLLDSRYVDEGHGLASFLKHRDADGDKEEECIAADTMILCEPPLAVAQQLISREHGIRCCPFCLRFVSSTKDELERLSNLASKESEEEGKEASTATSAALNDSETADLASFLDRHAQRIGRTQPGGDWFLPSELELTRHLQDESERKHCNPHRAAFALEDKGTLPEAEEKGCVSELRKSVEKLRDLGSTYDERVFLMNRILVQLFEATLAAASPSLNDASDDEIVSSFKKRFQDDFVASFDDGATHPPTEHQRMIFRQSCDGLNDLLWSMLLQRRASLVAENANDEQHPQHSTDPALVPEANDALCRRWITLQDYFTMRCVLDANSHTCIVVNPIWSVVGDALKNRNIRMIKKKRKRNTNDDNTNCSNEERDEGPPENEREGDQDDSDPLIGRFLRLRSLLASVPESLIHNMGVALHPNGSKINHSCAPNAKFIPTPAPARAACVALKPIRRGEEVRISYIDETSNNDTATRRAALKKDYGFDCDCSRCQSC